MGIVRMILVKTMSTKTKSREQSQQQATEQ